MKLKLTYCNIALIVLVISVLASCKNRPSKTKVDLIVNSKVLNIDFKNFSVKQIIVNNGKIVDVVSASDSTYEAEVVINSGFVYPGFIDAHCHFVGYANTLDKIDLTNAKNFDEILDRLKQKEAGEFIYARGWNQNEWDIKEYPDNSKLSELFPDIPVVLGRVDGHAVIVNNKSLELSGITADSHIEGGEVVLKNGKPTGVLIDNAVDLLKVNLDNANLRNDLLTAQENCFAVGLTTLDDAGLDWDMIMYLDSLQRADELKIRIYAMVSDNDENYDKAIKNGIYKTDRMNVRSFKFYADGALGSRGACLLEPYTDHEDYYGLLLSERDHFLSKAQLLLENGFQVNTHAIGDSANRLILNVYKEALAADGNDKRWRIEHAQVLSKEDFHLFNDLGVLPSVQPTHATSDMLWADERLGEDRLQFAYAYQDLLNSGGVLPLGTDFPVEDIDPLKTFYAAVVRKNLKGVPEGGFQMENSISRIDALKGMTLWAAYSNFEELEKGTIETGKFADFTILDTDLLTCDEDDILKANVLFTIVDGEVVFTKN